jgi:hypothetical protein
MRRALRRNAPPCACKIVAVVDTLERAQACSGARAGLLRLIRKRVIQRRAWRQRVVLPAALAP